MPEKLSREQLENKIKQLEKKIIQAGRVKTELAASELEYKTLVHNIPGMVYRAFPDWSAEIISGCENLCGFTEQELNSKDENWLAIVHPDDKENISKNGYTLTQTQKEIVQKYRIITKSSTVRWVEDRKVSLFSENGEFLGIEGIVYDITERLQTEEKLQEKEYIIESASSVIATADLHGKMTYVNPRFLEIWGFKDRSEIYGRHFQEFWQVKGLLDEILSELRSGKSWSAEIRAVKKDGTVFDVQVLAAMVYNKAGNPVGLMSSSIEITDRKKTEREKEKLIKKLQDALSEIKVLQGILPICAECKKIRDDQGYWYQIEKYIHDHSEAEFSHGICPECAKKLYPNLNT